MSLVLLQQESVGTQQVIIHLSDGSMDSHRCYFEEHAKNELILCPNVGGGEEQPNLFKLNNI